MENTSTASVEKFCVRLKELRSESGLSQNELAQKLYVNQRTVSNWEKGTREPNIAMIVRIAKFFDVSADYLLGVLD